MKKLLGICSIFTCLLVLSSAALGATTIDTYFTNAKPGFKVGTGLNIDPYNCRAAVANLNGSGDSLLTQLNDHDENSSGIHPWGPAATTTSASRGTYYYTPKATTSCEKNDGAYAHVRNVSAPTEKLSVRYQYNY